MTGAPRAWRAADSHVHLDAYDDPAGELAACAAAGVQVVVSTLLPSEYRRLRESLRIAGAPQPSATPDAAAARVGEAVQLGLGYHPTLAAEPGLEEELVVYAAEFASARWLSEIGLDGFVARSGEATAPGLDVQEALLERLLEPGTEAKLLSVHSREAEARTIDIIVAAQPGAAAFHWFAGDLTLAARVLDAGFSFSVNSMMLQDAARHELLRWVPAESLLLETDGPTTTLPDGRGCRPVDVLEIAEGLAALRRVDAAALITRLQQNFDLFDASVP